jgi:DNA repair exonuclease SbcCD ATPase subunit
MNSTILNIKAKYQEAKDERDLKYEKAKLKEEDTLENAARLKKAELKKKLKILEKHYELDKRLETLKEEKDRANEKKRDDAHKNVMEKVKLKKLKIMVEKTKDPIKMHKILDEFYRQPLEQLKPIELPSKDIV